MRRIYFFNVEYSRNIDRVSTEKLKIIKEIDECIMREVKNYNYNKVEYLIRIIEEIQKECEKMGFRII